MSKFIGRKHNRLENFDYSQNGNYFITICAKNQKEIFAAIDCRGDILSPTYTYIGTVVENEINVLNNQYCGVSIDCYVIMPNHVHMIIGVNCSDNGRQNVAPTISRMIQQWKRAVSIKIGNSVWQKSFHDHIIRNESDYKKITEYIENNPYKWKEDCYYQNQSPVF